MKLLLSCIAVVALVSWTALYAQAGMLSDQEFKKLAASHSSAEEHQKLAAHYTAHAMEHEADAKLHEELATQYAKPEPSRGRGAPLCCAFAGSGRGIAGTGQDSSRPCQGTRRQEID